MRRIAPVLLGAGAIVVYAGTFHAPFVYDDVPALVGNASLHPFWPLSGPLHPPAGALTVSGRPLLNLSFALNYAISGGQVWSYHALNVLIHWLAGCTLFGLVARTARVAELFKRFVNVSGVTPSPWAASSETFALVAALLWTLHPLQTEAVTYTVQRAESLMGLCYLFTLYAFVRSLEGNRGCWQLLSVLSCWAGTGVKEVIVTAPLVVFLYDWTFVMERGLPFSPSRPRASRARWIYYPALASSWLPLAYLVAANGGDRGGSAGFESGVSWLHYWLTQGEAVLRYLCLSLWPSHLVLLYGPLPARPWPVSVLLVALVLSGVLAAAVAVYRRKPAGFLGAAFFLILAPTSLIPGTLQEVVEHRMYLPLGCCVAAGTWLIFRAGLAWFPRQVLAFCAGLVIWAGFASAGRNAEYRSALALWETNVARRPGCAQAQSSYAAALAAAGRGAEAAEHYNLALALSPPDVRHTDLGLAWDQAGQPQAALQEYRLALGFKPHLAFAEINAGRALYRLGRLDEAQRQLRSGLADSSRVGSDTASAEMLLGICLGQLGRPAEAAAEFRKVVSIDPGSAEAHYNLGNALSGLGQLEAARAEFTKALVIRPGFQEARSMLQQTNVR